MDKRYKWTTIFLVRGANDNERELNAMLTQLATAKCNDGVAVILCININSVNLPACLKTDLAVSQLEGQTTLVYSLESDGAGHPIFKLLKQQPNLCFISSIDIADFFRDFVLVNYTAQKYAMFTWDHGQPFGIFPGHPDATDYSGGSHFQGLNPEISGFKFKQHHEIEACSASSNAAEIRILTITDLKAAIQAAFGEKTIDVLVMANCYLQFFDTGYELSPCVDYLVAFETAMYFRDAFDYKLIVQMLGHNPELTPYDLSRAIVSTFSEQVNGQNAFTKGLVALFANDLSWYPLLAKLIDELAVSLIAELPRHRHKIVAAIDKCAYLSPTISEYCLLDFKSLVRSLYSEIPSVFCNAPYSFFELALFHVTIASHVGQCLQDESGDQYRAPACFSIYLPKNIGTYNTSFLKNFMQRTSLCPTAFVKRFRWQAFVEKLAAVS